MQKKTTQKILQRFLEKQKTVLKSYYILLFIIIFSAI